MDKHWVKQRWTSFLPDGQRGWGALYGLLHHRLPVLEEQGCALHLSAGPGLPFQTSA